MKIALVVTLVVAAGSMGFAFRSSQQQAAHRCHTPCAIILPDNTQEDEFGLDYGWIDNDTPVVDIYTPRTR